MYSAFLLGLSLIGAASAQVANGVVAVPMPGSSASGSAPAVTASASASAAPSGSSPQASQAPSYGSAAPPSQYTPPPYYETSSAMPYSKFQGGGYKSMDCGYGYQKGSDGSCQKMSWVRDCRGLPYRDMHLSPFAVHGRWLLRDDHHQPVSSILFAEVGLLVY